jgi:O-antigen ligase
MSQGLLVNLALMAGMAAFAFLTTVSQTAALATAGGLVLCAGAIRRAEELPKLGLLIVTALVPLSYLGTRVALGSFNSLTKLVFLPALAVLLADRLLTRRSLVIGRVGLGATLFALALAGSYLINAATPYSLWFLSRFVGVLLLFFLTANALRSERDVAVLLAVIVAACALSAVGSIILPVQAAPNSFLHDGALERMTGWSTDDAPTFGANLLLALLICLYFAFVDRRPAVRLPLGAAAALLVMAIVRTYARGTTVAMALSVGFLLFKIRRRVSVPAILAALALAALCLAPLAPEAYWERMRTMFTQFGVDPTMTRRTDTYRIGLRLFREHSLLGLGPGNFMAAYMRPEFRFERGVVPSALFNLYLSVATQTGLLGLCAFGLIIGGAFSELRRAARSAVGEDGFLAQAAELLQVMLTALLIISLFEPTDLQKYLWIVLGAATAVGGLRRGGTPAAAPTA